MGVVFHGDIAIAGQNNKALVSFSSSKENETTVTSVALHTEHEEGKIAAWGPNNDFPQKLLKKIRKNGAALSGLRVTRKSHYGSGFILFKHYNKDGKRKITQVPLSDYPEINTFFKRNKMKRFHKEKITDLEYFYIAFPEFVLSKDYKKIRKVRRQKTAHCRFELMNESTKCIEHVYLSSKWEEGVDVASKYVSKVRLIDNYWSAEDVKDYCKQNKITNFVRPVYYPLVDESYYPEAEWHSVVNSGWLDIANSIPTFKKAFLEEKININFHIEVFEDYFERKYKEDWEGFKPKRI